MLTLVFSVFLLAYLFAGMVYTRKNFALRMYQAKRLGISPDAVAATKDQARTNLDKLHHGGDCNLAYSGLKSRGCDCRHRNEWLKNSNLLREAAGNEIQLELSRVPFWPLYMAGDWMRSGTYKSKGFDAEYTAMLESQLGITDK